MSTKNHSTSPSPNRHKFLKTTAASATLAAAAAAQVHTSVRAAGVDPSKKLKIGFVGTGGRGTGAAAQALSADDNVELHAMADVFPERIDIALQNLSKNKNVAEKLSVPSERRFVGLDGYQKVLDSGVDAILLTTTPGFRPLHLRAAVEAGVHIFAEKPMAVDVAGVHHVNETLKMAEGKNLSIVAGFCWRYHPTIRLAYQQVMDKGLIGDVTSVYATYLSSHSKPHMEPSERKTGESDVSWQLRNWYNYNWLGGGGLVEQAVHSIDKIGWVMGDTAPELVRGTGGLGAPQPGGQIFDHFHIAYKYPNNVWAHLSQRKSPGCTNENADWVQGTKGTLIIGKGTQPYIEDLSGKKIWSYRPERGEAQANMYQVEHDEFFASIRKGEPINDGPRMINSSAMAVAGRMSAECGHEMTWETFLGSKDDLFPNEKGLHWDDSFDPGAAAIPGITKIDGIG
jgi:predicted dehydrogenase